MAMHSTSLALHTLTSEIMASFRSGDAASPTSTLREHEGSRSISELIGQMDQVVKLLNEQKV